MSDQVFPRTHEVISLLHPMGWADEDALERGSLLHYGVHCALTSKSKRAIKRMEWVPDDEKPYVQTVLDFIQREEIVVIHSEERLINTHYGFCGTPDLYGMWKDRATVFDFKFAEICPTIQNQFQAEAYLKLLPKSKFVFLQVNMANELKVLAYRPDPYRWMVFQSAVNVWRFRHGHTSRHQ